VSGEPIQCHGSDGCDTISSACTPIIVIPGVMGSRLHFGASRTWDPDSNLSMLRWVPGSQSGVQTNRAALTVATASSFVTELDSGAKSDIAWNSGVYKSAQRELKQTYPPSLDQIQSYFGVKRNWASVAWGFYGPVLMRLEAEFNATRTECPVYAFGYDWRKSNADSGAKFKQFLLDTLKANPTAKQCIVVTHSMGGFVVRSALAGDGGDLAAKIRGVIHTVHPSNGAVACYTRFFSGVSSPVENIGSFDVASNVLATILGGTDAEYAYNMSGLPGPLQLLPNHLYQQSMSSGKWLDGLDDGADLGQVYAIYKGGGRGGLSPAVSWAQTKCGTQGEQRSLTVQENFSRHIATAQSFHESLAGAANQGYHANTVVMYSTGLDTMYAVRMNTDSDPIRPSDHFQTKNPPGAVVVTDKWKKIAYTRRPRGDGTVPDVSAACPGAQGATVEVAASALEHSKVFASAAFNNRLVFFLKKQRQPLAMLDGTDADGAADTGRLASDDAAPDGDTSVADAADGSDGADGAGDDADQSGALVAEGDGGTGDAGADRTGDTGDDGAIA